MARLSGGRADDSEGPALEQFIVAAPVWALVATAGAASTPLWDGPTAEAALRGLGAKSGLWCWRWAIARPIAFTGEPVVNRLRDVSRAVLERFVCAAIILVCANAVVRAQEPSQSDNYTASMLQVCRQYANATAQTGLPADLMFQQCMTERHCQISPRSAGYRCEPPGPMIIRPGA
jgi:hypothetical protein